MQNPQGYTFSLLRTSILSRLLAALVVVILLWLGVYWAMA